MKRYLFFAAVFTICSSVMAQNNRINTYGNIGWYSYFGTFKWTEKFSLHTEYQWRRDHFITRWQQGMLRIGLNYQPATGILFRAGYAWIETFPYGEITINSLGRDFTEHRIFEMAQLSHKESVVSFSHRFMLEQRFVGKYGSAASSHEDAFPLLNRIRYQMRMQIPLKGKEKDGKSVYLAAFDEILIGFGRNVNANVFDQNRTGILLGCRFNKKVRLEAGYLSQILQLGRQINGKNVFQNNNGISVNAHFNIDAGKKVL